MNPSSSAPSAISTPSALKTETETKREPKQETKPKRQRARPFQTLPEFAALNRDQLAYVHDILRTKTLEDAQREIWTELGLQTRLDLCTLHRYKHKVLFAESLDLVDDATSAVDQLNDLLAGRETKIPAAGRAVVQQRALALANDPETKPSLFANLHRIFTYEDRREENRHRLALAAEREATRKELAEERKAMNAHKRALDLEKIKLAQQREHNRHQLATDRLALDQSKQAHREALHPAKKSFDQDRMTKDVNALLAAGGKLASLIDEARALGIDTTFTIDVFKDADQLSAPHGDAPCNADSLSAIPNHHPENPIPTQIS